MDNLYEETDLVDVKIKTQTLNQQSNQKNDKNYKPAVENSSYGAL